MGILDPVSEDTKPQAGRESYEFPVASEGDEVGKEAESGGMGSFFIGLLIFGLIMVAAITIAGGIPPETGALIIGAVVGLVVLLALLKLFAIADNSKAILIELRDLSDHLHDNNAAGKPPIDWGDRQK